MALTELARYLPRNETRNRYLRHGYRTREQEAVPRIDVEASGAHVPATDTHADISSALGSTGEKPSEPHEI
jgi:hypothetical protein